MYLEKRTAEGWCKKKEYTAGWFKSMSNERRMLYAAKNRAKRLDREFDIYLKDVVCPSVCPILGIPLIKGEGRQHSASPSLDRIDSTKGYIKGNVQVISQLANTMKGAATPEQLVKFAKWIGETYNLS